MSNIKIQDVDQRIQYSATNLQTVFTVPFPFLASTDLVVYQNSTKLTMGAGAGQYGVSGAGNPSGGTVTLVTGATTNDIITIFGNQPIDRTSIYSATISNLTGSDLNNDFNREIIMLKQIWTTQNLLQLQYQPYAQVSQDETVTRDRWLPRLGPGQMWRMNTAGTAFEVIDVPESGFVSDEATLVTLTDETGTYPNSLPLALLANSLTGGMGIPAGTTAQRVIPSGNNIGLRYNTSLSAIEYYAGGTWIQLDDADLSQYLLLAGGTMSGDISMGGVAKVTDALDPTDPQDYATKAYVDGGGGGPPYLPLAGGTMTGAIAMGTFKITGLGNPTDPQDAATKFYVDQTTLNGTSVYAATTATLNATQAGAGVGATLTDASGTFAAFSIDGVSPAVGQNILNKNQANAAHQGIWTLTTNGDGISIPWVLTRAVGFDTATEINNTGLIVVQAGTANADTVWYNAATIVTVDTTNFSFNQWGDTYALKGANADITSMSGLTGALRAPTGILDSNGNEVLTFSSAASAVNYIDFLNSATGNNPRISALGDDANIGLDFLAKGTGVYNFLGTADTPTIMRLFEDTSNGTNYVGLKAPATLAGSLDFELPAVDGSAGYVLQTNGAGVWSFVPVPSTTLPAGTLFNTVQGTLTSATTINSAVFVTTGLTVSITPTSASNKVLVRCSFSVGNSTASTDITQFRLYRNGTNSLVGDAAGVRTQDSMAYYTVAGSNGIDTISFEWLDSPATTGATTYELYALTASPSAFGVNRTITDTNSGTHPRTASTITASEVKG